MHHTLSTISIALNPQVLANEVNNAALLSFGNMVSLTSPLILKTFGERRDSRPVVRINSPEQHELQVRNSGRSLSNITDMMRSVNVLSTQNAISEQISRSFEWIAPMPRRLNQQCGTNLE